MFDRLLMISRVVNDDRIVINYKYSFQKKS